MTRPVTRSYDDPSIPRFVVLAARPRLANWVKNAFGHPANLEVVADVKSWIAACAAATGPIVALADLRDADGIPVAPSIGVLKQRAPGLPIIVLCPFGNEASSDVRAAAQAGVDELLFGDLDESPHALRTAVARATRVSGAFMICGRLLPRVPRGISQMIEFALYYPREASRVAAVATALGVHRKTLVERCARAGAPPPGIVIQWARVVLAAYLIRSRPGSVELTALELEFSSATALRNTIKRYSGLTPSDLRQPDGFSRVLELCVVALHARRAPAIRDR